MEVKVLVACQKGKMMKQTMRTWVAVAAMTSIILTMSIDLGGAEVKSSPTFGVKVPDGHRQWELISVAQDSNLDQPKGIVGNSI